jgi:hypothetical protein
MLFEILLLQSALQPLGGFRPSQLSLSILSRKVLQNAVASGTSNPPTWRRTRDLERSNFRHKRSPASEATLTNLAEEGGAMGGKWPRNFAESSDFHVTFGFFYIPSNTTWYRRLYFPSEGRRAEDFFARKIRRLRPGLNPRTWVPEASTLPLDHWSRCYSKLNIRIQLIASISLHIDILR